MASFGHVAVGIAAARVCDGEFRWKTMVALAAFSLVPDLDVIAFKFGIPYAAPFGHRGATHSILFAIFAGVVAFALTRDRKAMLTLFLVVLSHPLLDSLTDGGLGVALWWPFSDERVFSPWTPIPVAPIGKGMLSARGAYVMFVEAAVSLPFILLAHLFAPKRAHSESSS
ncbi:MAG: metal-dependent hydrolase [Archangium gephyra]|uniref:Metal-dependent hydrolase n=1 Tax=Archangium gephyra TaxID=48 RepID=A0A2W5TMM7_9BACT|nr:MAG: metal-dependent hydrolase [Archangium gephyra]